MSKTSRAWFVAESAGYRGHAGTPVLDVEGLPMRESVKLTDHGWKVTIHLAVLIDKQQ